MPLNSSDRQEEQMAVYNFNYTFPVSEQYSWLCHLLLKRMRILSFTGYASSSTSPIFSSLQVEEILAVSDIRDANEGSETGTEAFQEDVILSSLLNVQKKS